MQASTGGGGAGQARRRARPEPVATGQATPAAGPLDATALSVATLGRGTTSDHRDGDAQRREGGAERDHGALAPAGNDAEPLAELAASVPRARIPYEGSERGNPAEPGCDAHELPTTSASAGMSGVC